jgi:hypothetical protein
MKTLEKKLLLDFLGNKIFTATFRKKDGSLRVMNCRLGVKKHLKGGQKSYNDDDFNYLTVFDLNKKAYRTINLNTLEQIKANGKIINL